MENRVGHEHDSRSGVRKKTLNPMSINDFLLTYMLLSPKPVVAVSTAITGAKSPVNDIPKDIPKAVDCYVLEIPWQREC